MSKGTEKTGEKRFTPYLSSIGAWALAFGCSVGWGAFVMPGTTFLPIAGPVGTAIGIGIGALVMLLLGANYHYLMNRFKGSGGVYTYTKHCFGYDHGFVSAWFLIITYIAVIWANASALPLIARTLLGETFQFGFHYEIAGFHVFFGEILLAVGALLIAAFVCLHRKVAEGTQILMALLLFVGIVICFVAAAGSGSGGGSFKPEFSGAHTAIGGVFTIFSLAPWAFVGFESISHSTAEAKFPIKNTFRILVVAVITGAAAYILLSLLAVTALPKGCSSWIDYVANLDKYSGVQSQPTFFAAHSALGGTGSAVLGVAALGGIFTGLIGNYIALSRLLTSMSDDGMLSGWAGKLDDNHVPRNGIIAIMLVSVVLPFLGRTAISWIVDVTTIGATIAYTYASASAIRAAKEESNRLFFVTGIAGFAAALLFALEFLIPNLLSVKTLTMQSYFILAAWSILGMIYFRRVFRRDKDRKYGRSVIVWVVLMALIIFASSVWETQETEKAIDNSVPPVQKYYTEKFKDAGTDNSAEPGSKFMRKTLQGAKDQQLISSIIQMLLILGSLFILFDIYYAIQKREKQIEVEKLLAEKSSRAKTSFLSNMSHEIRTPMNAIIGLDNIALRNPDLQPQTREQLEKIGASANHLLGLINDILDMSRIESGRMALKHEEFMFKEFLEQINIIINGQCVDKGLDYHCHIAGDLDDYYVGDDMKIKQVMINILGNSVKFTEAPGDVTLTVEEVSREDDVATLRFSMADTGIGMDEEYIPTIFEAFSQEDAAATNKYGGSGLGMAITKNFVEMMNGDIDVQSEKGVGSTFTVTIQLGTSERKILQDVSTEEGEVSFDNLAGKRVLMAEDVDQNAEILEDLLDLEEIESEHAVNGQVAVDMFKDSEPGYYDAILMDVRMPVMDGLTATSTIRDLDREDAKTIPIIAMTANVFDEDVQKSLDAGMNVHLSKPIEPEKLYEAIARLIEQ